VATHKARLQNALPKRGAVRMMVVTERQFNAIEILVGTESIYDKPQDEEQLMTF
jgi:CRISPR-associated protein Cas2